MSVPKTTRQWVIKDTKNKFDGLELQENVEIPPLGDYDVLVKIHAVSLNYRDLIIPQVRCSLAIRNAITYMSRANIHFR